MVLWQSIDSINVHDRCAVSTKSPLAVGDFNNDF